MHWIPIAYFTHLLGVLLLLTAVWMTVSANLLSTRQKQPTFSVLSLALAAIVASFLSSVTGVATGVVMLPSLKRQVAPLDAIGTSVVAAVIGCGVATGTYIYTGLVHATQLPRYSIGYVYLPAFFITAPCVFIFAAVGAYYARKASSRYLHYALTFILGLSGLSLIFHHAF